MSLVVGDNFSLLSKKPLDGRIKYDTLAAMVAMADDTLYEGCIAYCAENDKNYQWKSTNPIDPDTGKWREFSSGGGETIQVTELPAASEDEEGKIYQYIGADTSTLTHGYYYECVSDGEDPATYSWEPTKVQDMPEAMSQNDVEEIINGLVIDPLDMPEPMTQSDLEEVKDAFSPTGYNPFTIGIGGGYAPIGTIIQYMGVTAPQDYLICDGTVYNIADYPQLAEFFTAQFGAANHFGGDGTTTFAVPDLRGEFLRGSGTNSHANQGSGAAVGIHQNATEINNPEISFSYKKTQYWGLNDWNSLVSENPDSKINKSNRIDITGASAAIIADQSKATGCVTTRPTNTSVLYCIKAIVAGEVYSTEERVVGTWIDGKKIYQKTIPVSLPGKAQSPRTVSATSNNHNISNFAGIISCDLRWYDTVDNLWYCNFLHYSDYGIADYGIQINDSSVLIVSNNPSTGLDWSTRTTDAYVTIRYTKTTD